jgi:signal transduction histidine kinase
VDITQHKKQAWAGQRVRQSLLLGQEAERKRLANDLHDDISQSSYSLVLRSAKSCDFFPAADDGVKQRLGAVRDQIEGISSDVRQLSHNLHPATIVHLGLVTALNKLCGKFSEQAGINVEFVGGPMPDRLFEEDLALALFRITQEALANVVKHSESSRARVSLSERDGSLHLAIADQGIGFDVEGSGALAGLGLTSIRERAWLIGGELHIRSTPSQGTQLDLSVPLGAARKTE